MALYLAAAMHDHAHPGVNNTFLVTTRDPLAVLYNDRSVLENHHASSAIKILEENDFCSSLRQSEKIKLRFLIIECILATDLTCHNDVVNKFKSSLDQTNFSVDMDENFNRVLILKMLVKLADISNVAKQPDLHFEWAEKLVIEFFSQGDKEVENNIPISKFMNREEPEVSNLQIGFIENIVTECCYKKCYVSIDIQNFCLRQLYDHWRF